MGLMPSLDKQAGRLVLKMGSQTISPRLEKADRLLSRMKGLLFEHASDWKDGRALWIEPCSSIHTFGMSFEIDVLFLDRNLKVKRRLDRIKPNRLTAFSLSQHSVVEFLGGHLESLCVSVQSGSQLEVIEELTPPLKAEEVQCPPSR